MPTLCAECGQPFAPHRHAAYCSTQCKARAKNRRHKASRVQRGMATDPRTGARRNRGPASCPCCLVQFNKSSSAVVCCSRRCASAMRTGGPRTSFGWRRPPCGHWYTTRGGKRCGCKRPRPGHAASYKRRTARFGGVYTEVDRDIVFARDNWTCMLCHQAVDRQARWPAHAAVSLDHITPLAQGGDHTYANVQCAHLGCNWSKNDGRSNEKVPGQIVR